MLSALGVEGPDLVDRSDGPFDTRADDFDELDVQADSVSAATARAATTNPKRERRADAPVSLSTNRIRTE